MKFVHIHYSDEKALSRFLSCKSYSEAILKADIAGYSDIDIQEDFEKICIRDFLLVKFKDKVVPFQVLKKNDDKTIDILSYYILEERKFDKKTNVWRDSDLRKYLNSDFLKNFNDDFLSHLKEKDVHTEDYITKDRFWLLSHEEVNYNKYEEKLFNYNESCTAYSIFSDNNSRKRLKLNMINYYWWLRSSCISDNNFVGYIFSSGRVNYNYKYSNIGVLPACTIF